MVESVDTTDLKSVDASREGSSPSMGTPSGYGGMVYTQP
jgi:hypothetical protein